jgi:hypothetical protein
LPKGGPLLATGAFSHLVRTDFGLLRFSGATDDNGNDNDNDSEKREKGMAGGEISRFSLSLSYRCRCRCRRRYSETHGNPRT